MKTSAIALRAWLWLLLAVGVAIACASQLAGRPTLETNVLALLPSTERNPAAEQAVARLAEAAGHRVLFLIGHDSPPTAFAAARDFAAQLQRATTSANPAPDQAVFKQVRAQIPALDLRQLSAIYRQHRYTLLAPADQAALASGDADLQGRLQRKLHAPLRLGLGLGLSPTEDPFGLTDAWLASLPLRNLALEPEDGLLVARGDGKTWVFVSAELNGSAYDGAVQQVVASAVAQAEAALLTRPGAEPGGAAVQILRTGTVFYAGAARASAEREFDLIGAGSVLGMLLMLYWVFRSLRPLALGLLSVGFGIATAVAATIWVHGEMHLITLVFGASLIGEAIDYAVQYFAAHLGAGPTWEPMAGLRRVAPGLALALATSALGYGALMLAPFPALSQIALFALVGLAGAWLSVFLLLPALLQKPSQRDPQAAVGSAQRLLVWWRAHMSPRACAGLALVLLTLAAPGWWALQGNDDVRLLINRPAALMLQEERIRSLTGLGNSSQFFLVEGATSDAVLAREQALAQRLDRLVAQDRISGYQSLSSFVPTAAQQERNRALWQAQVFGNEAALKATLDRAGLRETVAAEQIAAFKAAAGQTLTLEDWLQSPLSSPYRHLWLGATTPGQAPAGAQPGLASVVLPQGAREVAMLVEAAADLPGVTLVDKSGSVSALFRSYRHGGALWLAGALCLVYGVLVLRYGWRQAAVVLAPTPLAMALALGLIGHLGLAINLFNLMALMLVLGVGVNYAIFLREYGGGADNANPAQGAAALAGVLLSAATTVLSFGLLAFSAMPALASFGLTLLVGIAMAVLLAPMVLSFPPRGAP